MGLIQHIVQLVREHASVPQSALADIFPGSLHVRLLFKGGHGADGTVVFRDDIAVFFAWVGGLDAHEHQVGGSFGRLRA